MNDKYYQDGAEFYSEETGELVFKSSIIVKDFDMEAATKARIEFDEYLIEQQIIEIKKQIPDAEVEVINPGSDNPLLVIKSNTINKITERMTPEYFAKMTKELFNAKSSRK